MHNLNEASKSRCRPSVQYVKRASPFLGTFWKAVKGCVITCHRTISRVTSPPATIMNRPTTPKMNFVDKPAMISNPCDSVRHRNYSCRSSRAHEAGRSCGRGKTIQRAIAYARPPWNSTIITHKHFRRSYMNCTSVSNKSEKQVWWAHECYRPTSFSW